jgi:hypothetical protein
MVLYPDWLLSYAGVQHLCWAIVDVCILYTRSSLKVHFSNNLLDVSFTSLNKINIVSTHILSYICTSTSLSSYINELISDSNAVMFLCKTCIGYTVLLCDCVSVSCYCLLPFSVLSCLLCFVFLSMHFVIIELLTRLPNNRGRTAARKKGLVSCPKGPDRQWGPSDLLFNG